MQAFNDVGLMKIEFPIVEITGLDRSCCNHGQHAYSIDKELEYDSLTPLRRQVSHWFLYVQSSLLQEVYMNVCECESRGVSVCVRVCVCILYLI